MPGADAELLSPFLKRGAGGLIRVCKSAGATLLKARDKSADYRGVLKARSAPRIPMRRKAIPIIMRGVGQAWR
ncbi:hypothetical protein EVA_18382, partial [gut metagenome]